MSKLKFVVNETVDTLCEQASKLEDEGEAQILLLRAYALKPSDKTVNYNMGLLYQKWDNIDQAIRHFEDSFPVGESFFHLGNLYRQKGDDAKSNFHFENGRTAGCKKCIDKYSSLLLKE